MKENGSWIVATPLVHEKNIYFGTSDSHRFYGLDAKTGKQKRSISLNMRVYGEAVADSDEIIFGCFNGKLYSMNHLNGEFKQLYQTEESKKNYYNIYDKTEKFRDDFELYGNDTDVSEKKILGLGAILTTPIIDNEIIYFGDANGFFYALYIK